LPSIFFLFEQFDRIAGRILDQDLPPARTAHHIVAKMRARGARAASTSLTRGAVSEASVGDSS